MLPVNDAGHRPRVLFVDNSKIESHPYRVCLDDVGFDVSFVDSAEEALRMVATEAFSIVILDVMMEHGAGFTVTETMGGMETGVALARKIRKLVPRLKIVALTNSDSSSVREFFSHNESTAYFHRATVPREFAKAMQKLIGSRKQSPRVFIVHGHEHSVLLDLKNFLQNRLGFDEPVILFEQPSGSRTLIEKFEYYARDIDIAFVLATADDLGRVASKPNDSSVPRARQNVVFELG